MSVVSHLFRRAAVVLVVLPAAAFGGTWDFTGELALDPRVFFEDGAQPAQDDNLHASVFVQPEARWESESRDHLFTFVTFFRYDEVDEERSHGDIRELFWNFDGGDFDITVGINKVFWGVTESRHLVDVINQVDVLEDIDEEDRLGQPMVNVNVQKDYGRFALYLLPYFREREFPGTEGRLRTPVVVDNQRARYESDAEQTHLDLALRYNHYFGAFDVGAYLFSGTSREPRLLPDASTGRLIPFYDQMTQLGVDVQYTTGAWLWKLESIYRDTDPDSFFAAVAGFEYTLYQLFDSSLDLGLLLEYQYDGRDAQAPLTLADNDVFAATRLAFNDPADTAVLAGMVVDHETGELFFNVEAERRLASTVFAELRLRAFANADDDEPLAAVANDDYLQLRLSWFFL